MADDNGWIKLHRKLLKNPIMQNAELLQLFVYCLLKANHDKSEFIFNGKMQKVERGSFITGLHVLCGDLKQKQTSIHRRLKVLRDLGYIGIKSEKRFSVISIAKYDTYQLSTQQGGNQMENKGKSSGNQVETNNNDNNEKNEEEIVRIWNEFSFANGLPQVQAISPIRTKGINERLSDTNFNLTKILEEISNSNFLKGINGKWKIDFDWLFLSPDNYVKVLEGKYRNLVEKKEKKLTLAEKDALFGEVAE